MFCTNKITTPTNTALTIQLKTKNNFINSKIFKSTNPQHLHQNNHLQPQTPQPNQHHLSPQHLQSPNYKLQNQPQTHQNQPKTATHNIHPHTINKTTKHQPNNKNINNN